MLGMTQYNVALHRGVETMEVSMFSVTISYSSGLLTAALSGSCTRHSCASRARAALSPLHALLSRRSRMCCTRTAAFE